LPLNLAQLLPPAFWDKQLHFCPVHLNIASKVIILKIENHLLNSKVSIEGLLLKAPILNHFPPTLKTDARLHPWVIVLHNPPNVFDSLALFFLSEETHKNTSE
jgi:hypothetical protein